MLELVMIIYLAVCGVGFLGAFVWLGIAEHRNSKEIRYTFPTSEGRAGKWEDCPYRMKR